MPGWTSLEGWIWMGVWIVALVTLVAFLVHEPRRDLREDARAILRNRFARGEISEEELGRALAAVASDAPAAPMDGDGGGQRPPRPETGRAIMTDQEAITRRERRAQERAQARQVEAERRRLAAREQRLRTLAFGLVVVAVLAVGGYLAFGDFFSRPNDSAASGVIDVQSSMAGFTPSEIHVKAGQTVTFKWWTQDAAPHLDGGVHTMVSPDLGLNEKLPAESTRLVTWTVPDKPGTYDVWCESCCGGKDAPQMHGKIVVEPASAVVVHRVPA